VKLSRVVRKRLRSDAEIEEVVLKRLERSGSAVVMSILGNFSVDRGEFRTASERVVSVMSRMVEWLRGIRRGLSSLAPGSGPS
jgi:hypothetical protein